MSGVDSFWFQFLPATFAACAVIYWAGVFLWDWELQTGASGWSPGLWQRCCRQGAVWSAGTAFFIAAFTWYVIALDRPAGVAPGGVHWAFILFPAIGGAVWGLGVFADVRKDEIRNSRI